MIRPQPNPPQPDRHRAYHLEEQALVGPPLPGEVIVAETADKLIDLVAAEMVVQAKGSVTSSWRSPAARPRSRFTSG
ncbi:MAG: hypothetical protein ACYS15_17005 [Planctomycetota bacterium]